MVDKEKKCPVCHSEIIYFGEGGYGKCKDNNCTFEEIVEGCNTIPCDDFFLYEEEDIHSAKD